MSGTKAKSRREHNDHVCSCCVACPAVATEVSKTRRSKRISRRRRTDYVGLCCPGCLAIGPRVSKNQHKGEIASKTQRSCLLLLCSVSCNCNVSVTSLRFFRLPVRRTGTQYNVEPLPQLIPESPPFNIIKAKRDVHAEGVQMF